MLTVKLFRGQTVKVMEAVEVDIFKYKTKEAVEGASTFEISVVKPDGQDAFYVSNVEHGHAYRAGLADCVDLWEVAYIENAQGSTIEKVKPQHSL